MTSKAYGYPQEKSRSTHYERQIAPALNSKELGNCGTTAGRGIKHRDTGKPRLGNIRCGYDRSKLRTFNIGSSEGGAIPVDDRAVDKIVPVDGQREAARPGDNECGG